MAKWNALSEESKKDIYEMMDAGMTSREIADLIGVKQGTIYNYRKAWKKARVKNEHETTKDVEPKEESSTRLEDSDYAKAYLADDPAVVRSSFDISRNVRIRSRKSGILYEMDECSDTKILKITLDDGQIIAIELTKFEHLCDEGIDVFLELKKTA